MQQTLSLKIHLYRCHDVHIPPVQSETTQPQVWVCLHGHIFVPFGCMKNAWHPFLHPKNLLMGLLLMGCFQGIFERENGPSRHSGKQPIKVGKDPFRTGNTPIRLMVRSRRPASGVSRALRARSVPGVSPRVSPKMGGVRGSVPGALRAPGSPKSVPRVSTECQKGVPDTPGTLSGHFLVPSCNFGLVLPRDRNVTLLPFRIPSEALEILFG